MNFCELTPAESSRPQVLCNVCIMHFFFLIFTFLFLTHLKFLSHEVTSIPSTLPPSLLPPSFPPFPSHDLTHQQFCTCLWYILPKHTQIQCKGTNEGLEDRMAGLKCYSASWEQATNNIRLQELDSFNNYMGFVGQNIKMTGNQFHNEVNCHWLCNHLEPYF